jgi:hypothetical protein
MEPRLLRGEAALPGGEGHEGQTSCRRERVGHVAEADVVGGVEHHLARVQLAGERVQGGGRLAVAEVEGKKEKTEKKEQKENNESANTHAEIGAGGASPGHTHSVTLIKAALLFAGSFTFSFPPPSRWAARALDLLNSTSISVLR